MRKRKTQSAPIRIEMPDRIPLAQNKEFKSIKNEIIREAMKLNLSEDELEESKNVDDGDFLESL